MMKWLEWGIVLGYSSIGAISAVLIDGVITAYLRRPLDMPSLGLVPLGSFVVAFILNLVFVWMGERLPPASCS
jgi:hypothetical protein